MTILEKIEIYGKYFMDLATDLEVEQYWELVDGVDAQQELDTAQSEIQSCEDNYYTV